ncbi:Rne/Rng family ribonuclease [Actinomycetaceae bacterium MB13-C1-2]|nr:Rne/Rng family ribonuclease [Actinomycetaceae bacterium MB13-C1-2]
MNIEDKAPEEAKSAPAAALLFQAPEFTAPVFQAPPPTKQEEAKPDRSGERDRKNSQETGRRNGASNPSEDADLSNKDSANKDSGARSGKNQQKSKRTKKDSPKGEEGKQDPASDKGQQKSKGGKKKQEKDAPADDSAKVEAGDVDTDTTSSTESAESGEESGTSTRRRRRRSRSTDSDSQIESAEADQVKGLKGSTRLEAKRMRRREGRRESRRRQSITESEFLARREAVDREMVVRHRDGADQIAVLEDGILVEHFVARRTAQSIVGNSYLGRVQNVLPSMEAAFVDIGRGRNAVLYAGEVNWDALGMEGKPRRIETALSPGDTVMVQVTKDPIGHKGARLTSQITLAGRYLVFVPGSSMLGISRKLPDVERNRLKKLLKEIVPEGAGVIVRTAAEGASEEQLRDDVERLTKQWASIEKKAENTKKAPVLLRGEPELVVRVVRDLFNEDFSKLIVQGDETWNKVHEYVSELSPELTDRLEHWIGKDDVFEAKKVSQQLAKAMDRKVWLPSGGTLIIERTEALTVVDVNTGKFVGSGGTLEETVTRNNLEAAEEIVRQLRLRDIGGIVIIDFVDMVLESNRELVLRRLVECLGRDRTRHQVTEITSLGLVQMTRKRVGEGLVEAFSTTCDECEGRGFIVHDHPVELGGSQNGHGKSSRRADSSDVRDERKPRGRQAEADSSPAVTESHVGEEKVRTALSAIAAATRPGETDVDAADPDRSRDEPAVRVEEPRAEKPVPAITLPEPSNEQRSRKAKSGTRRVVTRAAGSPPVRTASVPSKETDVVSAEQKHESAREAVRALFED